MERDIIGSRINYEMTPFRSTYRIAGIFRGGGGKLFVDARICSNSLKKMSGRRVKYKPHPLCTRRAMASSFEVEAMVRGYHQYIQSGMHKLANYYFPSS